MFIILAFALDAVLHGVEFLLEYLYQLIVLYFKDFLCENQLLQLSDVLLSDYSHVVVVDAYGLGELC